MGKKGSTLVPFLVKGLEKKKYGHYLTGNVDNIIQIILPRKTKNLCCDSMKILKDWNLKKGRPFKDENDYTKAKQGMLAALRRSVYLERIEDLKPKLCYKILNSKEVKEKKQKLKESKKLAPVDEIQSPSSVESGFENSGSPMTTDLSHEIEVDYVSDHDFFDYDSGFDSPLNLNELQFCEDTISSVIKPLSPSNQGVSAANETVFTDNSILNAVRHDHYSYSSNTVQNQDALSPPLTNEVSPDSEILDISETEFFTPLLESQYEWLLNDVALCDKSSFSDILKEDEVEQVYSVRILKFKSEHMQGTLLTCESVDEELLSKSVYDNIPLDWETSQRLLPYQVIEVKEDKDKVLFLFSDLELIALDGDISKRLKLSQIVEVKRLDKYVLFFLNPQKCIGSN